MQYHLLSYGKSPNTARAGIHVGDKVYDAAVVTGNEAYKSVMGALEDWDSASVAFESAAERINAGDANAPSMPLADVKLQAPILYPGQIFAAGVNYRAHVAEMKTAGPNLKDAGEKPWHFIKPSRSCVVGQDATVPMPEFSSAIDWEIELAAVIGKTARNVSVDQALAYVAGYTIANDVTVRGRDCRRQAVPPTTQFHFDWIAGKGFEGACPLGPWIVPARQIPDPHALRMRLWIGSELMQDASTGDMVFDTAEQIAMLSTRLTLHPGDLVLTGTPSGVGAPRGRFLQKGEKLRLVIDGIGELRHVMG